MIVKFGARVRHLKPDVWPHGLSEFQQAIATLKIKVQIRRGLPECMWQPRSQGFSLRCLEGPSQHRREKPWERDCAGGRRGASNQSGHGHGVNRSSFLLNNFMECLLKFCHSGPLKYVVTLTDL